MSYKKMDPEVKKVWINELRSGRYRQTQNRLRIRGGFCCLGVLCDLSGAAQWDGEDLYAGRSCFLPDSVSEWATVTTRTANDLSKRNDSGATFAEIADWIERHL